MTISKFEATLKRFLKDQYRRRQPSVQEKYPQFQIGRGTYGIPKAQKDAMVAKIPFGRAASPLDVAKVVLFFSSPLSDFVTGQELNVSGGMQIP